MSSRILIAAVLASTVAAGGALAPVSPAHAQLKVFDVTNYSQNVLTAARTLQQINNQITALQNQATMLQNQARQLQRLDFSSLDQLTRSIERIDGLMARAEGIAFDVAATDAALREQFPQTFDRSLSTDQIVQQARARLQSSLQGYRQTMRVQAQVVENVRADGALLTDLVAQSQAATGGLQAQQAGNQLMALVARQQLQLQSMMAAQYRADAIEQARQRQVMEAAHERTRRFIGTRPAYTPQ